jgi:hypothetical protein
MSDIPTKCPICQSLPWEEGDHYYVCGAWWDEKKGKIIAFESSCSLVNMTRERDALQQKLTKLKNFVSCDSIAITYQTFGQYRTEILNILNK